ncbi:MAG: acyl carrier protein [Rhodospirillaceae bacterium]|nr:acyl carrier protein [Rhodospirillaceae bacterium]
MSATTAADPSAQTLASLIDILKPFNKTGANLKAETSFTEDLNFDSLVVMEFVAVVEDVFDISIPLNILPDVATVRDLAVAIEKIVGESRP